MRRLFGLLVLLYGLLLALNTGLPTLGLLAGVQVQVTVSTAECTAPLGKPPFGGVYGMCEASWPGTDAGTLFGDKVNLLTAADAYTYPLLSDYAVLPPSNFDQVAAITAVLIVAVGILLLVAERKRAASDSGESGDGDSDDGDSGSDDGGGGGE